MDQLSVKSIKHDKYYKQFQIFEPYSLFFVIQVSTGLMVNICNTKCSTYMQATNPTSTLHIDR